jgi:aminopeptidase
MSSDFDKKLASYADLIVHIGLGLREGQNLAIGGKNLSRGAPISSAPLVRKVAESAYKAGARYVTTLWDDDQQHLIRLENADPKTLEIYPTWRTDAIIEHAKNGDAIFTIFAENPDLYEGQNSEQVTAMQHTMERNLQPGTDLLMKNAYNWTLVSVPTIGWAKKVFPDLGEDEAMSALWETIFKLCRIDRDDPVAAWKQHIQDLAQRSAYLNGKAYDALKYTGPGTDLTLGLPAGHIWKSAQSTANTTDITFVPNLPTEEVFSMPDNRRADGKVAAAMPLNYGGSLVDDFSLTFKDGKVVDYQAKTGEATLKGILEADEGARQLGEVALVPHSSPISQSGRLYYNTLYDENASCHLALGRAYQLSMQGGEQMTQEEFGNHGGNYSLVHIDFMIGSDKLDIDGITKDGKSEPILRKGEWAFDV